MENDDPVSYEGVSPGVPVQTRDGKEFGTLEHVLEVPELDVFDGIVVSTKAGLRFVDADRVAAITVGYIRCDLDLATVEGLEPPDGAPVYRVDVFKETGSALHDRIGRMFRRPRWTRE
jgi:hypothetical protein